MKLSPETHPDWMKYQEHPEQFNFEPGDLDAVPESYRYASWDKNAVGKDINKDQENVRDKDTDRSQDISHDI